MKKILLFLLALFLVMPVVAVKAQSGQGSLVRTKDDSAVYRLDGQKRYAFPDSKTYASWYGSDFSSVTIITSDQLAQYSLSGIVTYQPGSLIKIQTDPKVYEVTDDQGAIAWLPDEATAISRFGGTWAKLVRDVPDSFFSQYHDTGLAAPSASPAPTPTPTPTPTVSASWSVSSLFSLKSGDFLKDAAIVSSGNGVGVVWRGKKSANHEELYFASFDASGKRVDGDVRLTNHDSLPEGVTVVGKPSLVWNGSGYAVAWVDNRNVSADNNFYLMRLDTHGNKIGSELMVDSCSSFDSNEHVGLAWSGTEYAVAWTKFAAFEGYTSDEIYFARIPADASLVTFSDRITRDKYRSNNATLAWSGNFYGLAWNDATYDASGDGQSSAYETSFMLLDTQGNRLIERLQLSTLYGASVAIGNILWDGKNFAAWYSADSFSNTTLNGVYVARISTSGGLAIPMMKITTTTGVYSHPFAVAQNGAYAVAWTRDQKIEYANVSAAGSVSGSPEQLSPGTGDYAQLAWDGNQLTTLWRGQKDPILALDKNESTLYFGKK